MLATTNSSQSDTLHNLANISYKVIISEDLDVHIGVSEPSPELKRTLVAMSERTGMSINQVTDEFLYTCLMEMQELPELED